VEADPDLRRRLRAADDADRVARDIAEIERRVGERRGSLGRDFDAVVGVLAELGYVDASEWCLTDDGDVIAGLFHESDLLVAEAVGRGLFNGLSAPEVAALASCVVYEDRSPEPPPPARHPTAEVARRARSLERLHAELVKLSDRYGAPRPRDPDGGFSDIAFGWVDGESFADLVDGTDLTGGDFVRTIRQVVDLCEQLSQVAPDEAVATAAAAAVAAGVRGVVADSAVVQPAPEDGAAQQ
jgi:ATP-dependent RNA helicase HelY